MRNSGGVCCYSICTKAIFAHPTVTAQSHPKRPLTQPKRAPSRNQSLTSANTNNQPPLASTKKHASTRPSDIIDSPKPRRIRFNHSKQLCAKMHQSPTKTKRATLPTIQNQHITAPKLRPPNTIIPKNLHKNSKTTPPRAQFKHNSSPTKAQQKCGKSLKKSYDSPPTDSR